MSLESKPNNNRALEALRTELANPIIANLGQLVTKLIPSYGECKTFEHTTQYPEITKEAIAMIIKEYNQVMGKLITGAKENETDYQYCLNPDTGDATPLGLQVDMIHYHHNSWQVVQIKTLHLKKLDKLSSILYLK